MTTAIHNLYYQGHKLRTNDISNSSFRTNCSLLTERIIIVHLEIHFSFFIVFVCSLFGAYLVNKHVKLKINKRKYTLETERIIKKGEK